MRKHLAEIEIPGADGLTYKIPHPFEDIPNEHLPKKKQKWERPIPPDFLRMSMEEKRAYQERELTRMALGYHFYNNGELTYVTGAHYGLLTHIDLGGNQYPDFRWSHMMMSYLQDKIVNDPDCYGLAAFTMKRWGKTVMMPSRMLIRALLTEVGNFYIQATKDDKAEDVFDIIKRAFLALQKTLPFIYDHTYSNKHLHFRQTQTILRKSEKVKFKEENLIKIEPLPSKITSIQGAKITEYFLDEFASQEIMDMEQLFNTLIAQCTMGTKDIVGKLWMVSTVENAKSKGVPFAESLWNTSNPNERDANGRTQSGLYRLLMPYYLSDPSFINEYGMPIIEESKKYFGNMLESASETRKLILRRQFPEVTDDIFDVNRSAGLELDVVQILKKRRTETQIPKLFDISFYNGEVSLTPTKKYGQLTIELFEAVQEHHQYRVGIDAASTALNSVNKDSSGNELGDKKSEFSIVVHKITGGDEQYTDVANFCVRPEKRSMAEKVALWVSMYYNKYGNCKVYPERNASAGSTLTDLFEENGQGRLMLRQLKVHNSDRIIERNSAAAGVYMDGNNTVYKTAVMNKYLRLYGHKVNSSRIIDSLLKYGMENADLADAYGVGLMACGSFDPEAPKKEKKETPRQERRYFEVINGKVTEVWR
jgi:hypothetical protein